MNLFSQWYLRLFMGYWKMSDLDKRMIELHFIYNPDRCPEYIYIGNDNWLVSPPKQK